jgi:hypothetical protein
MATELESALPEEETRDEMRRIDEESARVMSERRLGFMQVMQRLREVRATQREDTVPGKL